MTGDAAPRRPALPERTLASRLIVVARAQAAEDYDRVLDELIEAGIRSIELTLTTPRTFDRLPVLLERYGAVADLGIGTVTSTDDLARAIDAGAHYVVTPITSPTLVKKAADAGMPIVPGGLTPTELFSSWSGGASAVKIFPAGQVGPGYVADLRGPFPDIMVVPSGGVDLDGARAWLNAGAVAVSVGGPLLGDAFRGGDLASLRRRAEAFVAVCARAEP
ncbi:bifunctional 4-hydroxy-2-oxoglutarate aldolase/2-dehydro-3-deoxy-phosphogluconate aldolase [Microbacterium rhizomatis]|uniref:Bifunctional 4-hydroxy-2-oxoglutarate aldolase/2-dehydro-3-deoxy-phosphogluconate aldolase n=1 Tax=Microbacterium rhizomatis TaxID=1631477 RepID=A0A5J5J0D5_9MICO|nr:bifunctional 4-hydroxy-2-oxoglutarate aldolase/2-dehydro-3-deoxy-phosphogluconate aldolase [Microbacterium rhizomatis]KAA9108102.1 bifunctional 4-hydroxy-2-oxoglutarate aldolase/2-dehydro-3-deoxy-phosphogluconate aldolase [Microbacterium rhizomatis]